MNLLSILILLSVYSRVKDFHDRAMDHWNQNLGLQSRRQVCSIYAREKKQVLLAKKRLFSQKGYLIHLRLF